MYSELTRRIAVTLCALLVFRIGAQIPIPGIPELVIAYANVPFYFGGVSALILVCVVLDIRTQFRAQARADGLVKQGG